MYLSYVHQAVCTFKFTTLVCVVHCSTWRDKLLRFRDKRWTYVSLHIVFFFFFFFSKHTRTNWKCIHLLTLLWFSIIWMSEYVFKDQLANFAPWCMLTAPCTPKSKNRTLSERLWLFVVILLVNIAKLFYSSSASSNTSVGKYHPHGFANTHVLVHIFRITHIHRYV